MDYKEKYEKALEKLQDALALTKDGCEISGLTRNCIEDIFPELAESETGKIKNEIKKVLANTDLSKFALEYTFHDMIEWLEKQGKKEYTLNLKSFKDEDVHKFAEYFEKRAKDYEINLPHRGYDIYALTKDLLEWLEKQKQDEKPCGKTAFEAIKEEKIDNSNKVEPKDYNSIDPHFAKPIDKVEPKFKVGDWIVDNENREFFEVTKVREHTYRIVSQEGEEFDIPLCEEDNYHKFTIKDAKDGDVLCGYSTAKFPWIGIFHELNDEDTFNSHCYLEAGINGKFCLPSGYNIRNVENHSSEDTVPATKEQRDTLFKAIHEAGYEWNIENKELKNVGNKNPLLSDFFKAEYERGKADALKSAWSEEDECYMTECINAIATKDSWSFEEKRKTKHWLKSLKERINENPRK